MSEFNDITHAVYNYMWRSYNNASNKVDWLRENTRRTYDVNDDYLDHQLIQSKMFDIVCDNFSNDFNIKLTQRKGNIVLQGLIIKEINKCIDDDIKGLTTYIFNEHRVKCFKDIFNPPPVGIPTDVEAIRCSICDTNKKDRVLPCGHLLCCLCVEALQSNKCPDCRSPFDKTKIIKIFL